MSRRTMFVRPNFSQPCRLLTFQGTGRRRAVRADSAPEDTHPRVDGGAHGEAFIERPSFMTRRGRSSSSRLKKSKRMEALAASLASKSRLEKNKLDSTAPMTLNRNISAPEFYRGSSSDSDADLKEAALDPSNEVEIPYDTSCQKQHYENDPDDLCVLPKPIYIISDCTGESAARTVRSALNQFESSIQAHCPTTLLMYRFVSDEKQICQIVEDAAKDNGLVVFTLVNPELVAVLQTACALSSVRRVDLWSELLNFMEDHLDASRSVFPIDHPSRVTRRALDPEYFKRIEAVEFTRKMDDGAHPEMWKNADMILLGVSRCGKTPLSIYLGQRGYKVANLPLVKDLPIPKELYEIDQSKIFALSIDAQHLFKIRRSRLGTLGVSSGRSMYADLKGVLEELEFAHGIYKRNPLWPVLDVTQSGVEETAARIERILSDRHGLSERVVYA